MVRPHALVLACALLSGACSSPVPAPPPNIVVVVTDTLRADRVGWYGGARAVTPALDRFAGGGAAVFWNAYAQGSSTSPSVASLLTSRYVSQHGVVSNVGTILADSEVTIAEVLKEHGYATGAFWANFLMTAERGFAQGFDTSEVLLRQPRPDLPKPRAAAVNEAALAWVEGLGGARARSLFLYVHYLEPHTPYTVPAEAVDRLVAQRRRSPEERRRTHEILADRAMQRFFTMLPPGEADLRAIEDLYDAEVMDVDEHVGALFAGLERRGVLERSIVAFVSDHGEEFLDHERLGHGAALYEETVRVPLAVRVSGSRERTDVREVVSLVDVAPTLLDLAGIPVPAHFAGRSFRDLLAPRRGWLARVFASDGSTERSAFLEQDKKGVRGEGNHRRALVAGRLKVVEHRNGETEFFDLEADAAERRRDGLSPEQRRRLLDLLQVQTRAVAQAAATPRLVEPNDAAKERLRALGYLE